MTRVCFTSRVRPDRLDEYRRRHAAVWPEMLEALRDTGWRDYHLFLSPEGLLVGVLETDDYAAAQEAMARTAVNPRWQAEMSGFFLAEGNPDEGFVVLDEVFHLEGQLRAAGLPVTPSSPPGPHPHHPQPDPQPQPQTQPHDATVPDHQERLP